MSGQRLVQNKVCSLCDTTTSDLKWDFQRQLGFYGNIFVVRSRKNGILEIISFEIHSAKDAILSTSHDLYESLFSAAVSRVTSPYIVQLINAGACTELPTHMSVAGHLRFAVYLR